MPRMKILNSVEREVFDVPPIFNSVERKRCFDFPTMIRPNYGLSFTSGQARFGIVNQYNPIFARSWSRVKTAGFRSRTVR